MSLPIVVGSFHDLVPLPEARSARRAPLRAVRGRTLVLPQENIDTDQIVPARFLLESARADWSDTLFAGWRFDASGREREDSPLAGVEPGSRPVLVAARNFGCGSSREHAAWALRDFGVRAVIAPSLADIFRRNALKNGVLAFEVDPAVHARLAAAESEVAIDLQSRTLVLEDGTAVEFAIDAFARHCLLEGLDELDFLCRQEGRIAAFEAASPRRSLRVPAR